MEWLQLEQLPVEQLPLDELFPLERLLLDKSQLELEPLELSNQAGVEQSTRYLCVQSKGLTLSTLCGQHLSSF